MKFKIILEVDGVDMWHTVMKVVENNDGITLLNPDSMVAVNDLAPAKPKRKSKRGTRATTMQSTFMAYAEENLQGKTFTRQDVAAWLRKEGRYNPNSASPLTSQLCKAGKLVNVAPKVFKLA